MAFKDMKDDLESLEYGKILAQIKSHASSEYGQRYLETHLPSSDIQQVEKWLKETEEAWELVRKNVDPFTFFASDVDAVVDLLNKQGYVPVEDFLNFVKAADVLVQLRRKLSAETGVLGSLAKRIVPLDAWLNDVRSKVDESGFVKDDASRKLSDIRRDQKRLSNEIQDKLQREMDRYQRFISDRLVVKRGNRYAIPVKSSNVPQVKGIVLDWSGSGQTAYVEPFSVVDMNNRLEELRFMEEQEIYRIFQELCSQLYPIAEEIRISLRILGEKLDAKFLKDAVDLLLLHESQLFQAVVHVHHGERLHIGGLTRARPVQNDAFHLWYIGTLYRNGVAISSFYHQPVGDKSLVAVHFPLQLILNFIGKPFLVTSDIGKLTAGHHLFTNPLSSTLLRTSFSQASNGTMRLAKLPNTPVSAESFLLSCTKTSAAFYEFKKSSTGT